MTPLSPDRYKLQLTISGDLLDKLRCAKDMLSHVNPSGDDEAVLDRALEVLLVELAKKKCGTGASRTGHVDARTTATSRPPSSGSST